jgi:hypothetical protein
VDGIDDERNDGHEHEEEDDGHVESPTKRHRPSKPSS